MLKLKRVRRTFYLEVKDSMAIEEIRQKYGVHSDSDAVRIALRVLAESPIAQVSKKKGKVT